jgi:hypothetical protein
MNDLGAVLLLALGDEVDAFWCFKGPFLLILEDFKPSNLVFLSIKTYISIVGLMDFREPYFDRNKMMEQLLKLERLIKRLDRFLYDHLEKHDALNLVLSLFFYYYNVIKTLT